MKITSWDYGARDGIVRLGIEFTNRGQAAAMEAAVSGSCFIRGDIDSGIVRHDRFSLPDLEPDPVIAPHFPGHQRQLSFIPYDHTPEHQHEEPPVYVQHLCGYNYTPENYRRSSEWMESSGFQCLRSRRGPDGKFWEIWYLPGPFAARGPIEGVEASREIAESVARNARPGSVTLGGLGGWFMTID